VFYLFFKTRKTRLCFVFVLELEVCFVVPRLEIGIVKDYIHEKFGIAPKHQILSFQGKKLVNDSRTLHECGLHEGSKGEIRSQQLILMCTDDSLYEAEMKAGVEGLWRDAWLQGQELLGRIGKFYTYRGPDVETRLLNDMEDRFTEWCKEFAVGTSIIHWEIDEVMRLARGDPLSDSHHPRMTLAQDIAFRTDFCKLLGFKPSTQNQQLKCQQILSATKSGVN
jgi:hypothetical protein